VRRSVETVILAVLLNPITSNKTEAYSLETSHNSEDAIYKQQLTTCPVISIPLSYLIIPVKIIGAQHFTYKCAIRWWRCCCFCAARQSFSVIWHGGGCWWTRGGIIEGAVIRGQIFEHHLLVIAFRHYKKRASMRIDILKQTNVRCALPCC